ncbi:MAG: serine hydrolase [Candidatus Campbellbacteria bacterium]|nr:serine hydrolase [Candidatus Campbellbacteria bacterium]
MSTPRSGKFDQSNFLFIVKFFAVVMIAAFSAEYLADSTVKFLPMNDIEFNYETAHLQNNSASTDEARDLSGSGQVAFAAGEDGNKNKEVTNETSFLARVEKEEDKTVELKNNNPPYVDASSYLVADMDSGQIYAEKRSQTVRPIASISKLMTALTAIKSLPKDREITATETAVNSFGISANLSYGEKLTLEEILYPLLLSSANDAALSISDYYGKGRFAQLMNRQARKIGMINSYFVEPSGLSEKNVSTAYDIYKLARHIKENEEVILEITQAESGSVTLTTPNGSERTETFRNIHQLRNLEEYRGGKNGYINESRQTLITTFEIEDSKNNKRNIAIIVLGSDNSTSDTLSLLSWIKDAL